jgi:uncharacterized repeat protein (TIGR03803 family)
MCSAADFEKENDMKPVSLATIALAVAPGLLAAPSADAASVTILHSFAKSGDGAGPMAGLIDVGGTLYGTTVGGGNAQAGTVFSITPAGVEKVIYSFQGGDDGANPEAGLINVAGTLYGTTTKGGGGGDCGGYTDNCGTVFSVTPSGSETVLHSFTDGTDGANPVASLINVNGMLYGTTEDGGGTTCQLNALYGCGTVFSESTVGVEKVVYAFRNDGVNPYGNLINVGGKLYGTLGVGAGGDSGAVFSLTLAGTEKILYSFQGGSDGETPFAGLTRVGSELYGTTFAGGGGGAHGFGVGTVFSITKAGTESVLYRFNGTPDGQNPMASLINVGGIFYGTTRSGGAGSKGLGTIFSLTKTGTETVLYSFSGHKDGSEPVAALIELKGKLYGTTLEGGAQGNGTVFVVNP